MVRRPACSRHPSRHHSRRIMLEHTNVYHAFYGNEYSRRGTLFRANDSKACNRNHRHSTLSLRERRVGSTKVPRPQRPVRPRPFQSSYVARHRQHKSYNGHKRHIPHHHPHAYTHPHPHGSAPPVPHVPGPVLVSRCSRRAKQSGRLAGVIGTSGTSRFQSYRVRKGSGVEGGMCGEVTGPRSLPRWLG